MMFRWQKQLNKGWLVFGLVVLLCLPRLVWGASDALRHLEQRYQQKATYVRKLYQRRQKQLASVQEAARGLALLKKQAERTGLLGLPARMRLPSARAAAEDLVKKVKRLDRRLQKHNSQLQRIRRKLRRLYRHQIAELQKKLRQTRTKGQRLALQTQWKSYQQRLQRLSQDSPRLPHRGLLRLRVSIDPLDGPTELRQKADVLKDQEDRIRRHMRKLQFRIKKVRQRYEQDRKDQKLAQRVRTMTSDDDLFNEDERNPRVTTGARTSERMRSRNGGNAALAGTPSATGKQSGSNTANRGSQEARNGDSQQPQTNPPPQGAAPSTGTGGKDGAPGSFTNSGGSTANPSAPGNNPKTEPKVTPQGTSAQQLRLGYGPGTSAGGDPLNPPGTLPQQLQALKQYQRALRQQIKQLRKKQQQFLKRAKTLQQQEERRRRR